MMATWRGTRPPEMGEMRSPRYSAAATAGAGTTWGFGDPLNLKEFGFLPLRLGFDEGDVLVGELLEVVLVAL